MLGQVYGADGTLDLDPLCLELAVAMQHAYSLEGSGKDEFTVAQPVPPRVPACAGVHASSRFEEFLMHYSSYKSQPLASACRAAWTASNEHLLPEQGAQASAPLLGLPPTLTEPLRLLLQKYSAVDGTVSAHALEEVAGSAAVLDSAVQDA